jgi:hypothetical protein
MDIKEWTQTYINFNSLKYKNNQIEMDETSYIHTYVEKGEQRKVKYFFSNELENLINHIAMIDFDKIYFVCDNTKHNVDFLISGWDKFISNPKLIILFIDINTQGKWLIRPQLHNSIADKESLKEGIYSLYSSSKES